MVALDLPEPYDEIDRLIESGDTTLAEHKLSGTAGNRHIVEVLRVKLAMATDSIPPGLAMQRLVQVMREDASAPGAQALYQEASKQSYQSRQSSMAHSHPPPPIKPSSGGDS